MFCYVPPNLLNRWLDDAAAAKEGYDDGGDMTTGDDDDDDCSFHSLMIRWEYLVLMVTVTVMLVEMRKMTVSDFDHDD